MSVHHPRTRTFTKSLPTLPTRRPAPIFAANNIRHQWNYAHCLRAPYMSVSLKNLARAPRHLSRNAANLHHLLLLFCLKSAQVASPRLCAIYATLVYCRSVQPAYRCEERLICSNSFDRLPANILKGNTLVDFFSACIDNKNIAPAPVSAITNSLPTVTVVVTAILHHSTTAVLAIASSPICLKSSRRYHRTSACCPRLVLLARGWPRRKQHARPLFNFAVNFPQLYFVEFCERRQVSRITSTRPVTVSMCIIMPTPTPRWLSRIFGALRSSPIADDQSTTNHFTLTPLPPLKPFTLCPFPKCA